MKELLPWAIGFELVMGSLLCAFCGALAAHDVAQVLGGCAGLAVWVGVGLLPPLGLLYTRVRGSIDY